MSKTYYRVTARYEGKVERFLPSEYYEPVNDNGMLIIDMEEYRQYGTYPEVCFGESIARSLFGMGRWLRAGRFYIYTTTTEPCVNLNVEGNHADFRVIGEVRYRKPVEAKAIGYVDVSQEMVERLLSIRVDDDAVWDVPSMIAQLKELDETVFANPIKKLPRAKRKRKVEREYEVGEIMTVFSYLLKVKVKKVNVLPTGKDYLVESPEDDFWINEDNEEIRYGL